VVWGAPPTAVLFASVVVTVPSALLLIGAAVYGVVRQRRFPLVYIALGAAILALGGSLYVVSFPTTLYYAEFAGVLLLFVGFAKVGDRTRPRLSAQPA
jgi:hypothetical protein